MNRTLIFLAIAAIATSSACTLPKESPFFAKFSISDLVTSNKSFKEFPCDPSGGGGGGGGDSIFSVGAGKGETHFQSHKSDSFACRVHSDTLAVAVEQGAITALRRQVEDSLRTYGANIIERGGRDSRSFYFTYAIKDIKGRIQVSGKRIGVDFYNFQADLEESK